MDNIKIFQDTNFIKSLKSFFEDLKVPINYIDDQATTAKEILKDTYKDNDTFKLINEVFFVGMVDDNAFEGNESLDKSKIKSDYDGVLIFGVTLHQREQNLLPTRSQLAEIARSFNREFYYTPAIVVFKYSDSQKDYLAFANAERMKYKQEWRDGEKAGKVSLLRDIDILNPHRGHIDILNKLKIHKKETKKVDSFAKLYSYWQEVFSVSLLNKNFYQDLSNWYFWAVKQVKFPNEPNLSQISDQKKLEEAVNEHNAKNVIRLLTRLLFTWFIKEKGLIPEELFDLEVLQDKYLNTISPFHDENSLLKDANKESIYYKAILQNLFFASLNCPINSDGIDTRERGFRRNESYGKHRGVDHLMRYEKYFKDPQLFLEMINKTVPFLNGGLFECLDNKLDNLYIDAFSDNENVGKSLVVPDYLFFGAEEKVDLEYESKNEPFKQASVKGLIPLLNSYKFTISENTPIEEDVALDPELLGKVFENLLASYNPETKTTARKQTGSFYTPREIVNYMVDESLIAYLKNQIKTDKDEEQWDKDLHTLFSFDNAMPDISRECKVAIIKALDKCTILDPACGSGAFPMGILQKMVHILQKLDPDNELWKDYQLEKTLDESAEVFKLQTKEEREERLKEINNAFDVSINHPDYARKLFLIENCIYGVDIQPIATQISKLRFFISLVVDQKNSTDSTQNFNVRPLPNLETKFVTANTLIGIEKENNLFSETDIKDLEKELKTVRHKLFSAKTPQTKRKYRKKDEDLRQQIAEKLIDNGFPLSKSEKLASWNPYDQNASSSFFDPEWMFDVSGGFDIVIGNPPYIQLQDNGGYLGNLYKDAKYETFVRTGDIYMLFYELGFNMLKEKGNLSYITSNKWMRAGYGEKLRNYFAKKTNPKLLIDFGGIKIFENATVDTNIILSLKENNQGKTICVNGEKYDKTCIENLSDFVRHNHTICAFNSSDSWVILSPIEQSIKDKIEAVGTPLKDWDIQINYGIKTGYNDAFIISTEKRNEILNNCKTKEEREKTEELIRPILRGRDIKRYGYEWADLWLIATFPSRNYNIKDYPSVEKYLLSIGKERLEQTGTTHIINGETIKSRKKTSNKWFETQDSIAYWGDFFQPKIMYSEIVKSPQFFLDENSKFFPEATTFIITGNNLDYIITLLNSSVISTIFKLYYAGGGLGKTGYRYKKAFLENLPIPLFDNKFSKIIFMKNKEKLNCFILKEMYHLSDNEIKYIESL